MPFHNILKQVFISTNSFWTLFLGSRTWDPHGASGAANFIERPQVCSTAYGNIHITILQVIWDTVTITAVHFGTSQWKCLKKNSNLKSDFIVQNLAFKLLVYGLNPKLRITVFFSSWGQKATFVVNMTFRINQIRFFTTTTNPGWSCV